MKILDGSINGLMAAINNTLFLPAIQRDFVWQDDRIFTLFDSILRNYPIGAISLWHTNEAVQHRPFLGDNLIRDEVPLFVFHDKPKKTPYTLVLDGQQRLQVLYLALNGQIDGRSLCMNLLSDPSDDNEVTRYQFAFYDASKLKDVNSRVLEDIEKAADLAFWVPMRELQYNDNVPAWASEKIDKNPALKPFRRRMTANLNTVRNAFKRRGYVHLIELDKPVAEGKASTFSVADVLEVFVRINTQQTRLSRGDLIFSLLKLKWGDAATSLNSFLRLVNKNNRLDIDNDFVIRCLFVVSGFGARLDLDSIRSPKKLNELKKNFHGCCDAIKSVIDFLQGKVFSAHPDYVGGLGTLVPFVYFAYRCPGHKLPRSGRDELTKALFVLAQTRTASRYIDSRVTKHVNEILKNFDYEAERLAFPFEETVRWVANIESIEKIDPGYLQYNYRLALALIQNLDPSEPLDGENKLEMDHIYPRAILDGKNVDWYTRESIGNYWLLPRTLNRNKSKLPPKKFLTAQLANGKVTKGQLNAACIKLDALHGNGHTNFISNREEALVKKYLMVTGLKQSDFKLPKHDGTTT